MAARQSMRACTAALKRITALVNSSHDVGAASCQQQLSGLLTQLTAAAVALPQHLTAFGSSEQEVMRASCQALTALAADRHSRSKQWVRAVITVFEVSALVEGAVFTVPAAKAQLREWLPQQGPALLPALPPLLAGVSALVRQTQPDLDSDASVAPLHALAASCLCNLLRTLVLLQFWLRDNPRLAAPAALAATELAHLLVNGSGCAIAGSCSCCLASGASVRASMPAPVLSPSRAQGVVAMDCARSKLVGQLLSTTLYRLSLVYTDSITCSHQSDSVRRAAVSKGGLLLALQHLAALLAKAREHRAAAHSQRSSSSRRRRRDSVPSCAEPSAFLGGVDAAALAAIGYAPALLPSPGSMLHKHASCCALLLEAVVTSPSAVQCCPSCTPAQLLLMLEAATMYPEPIAVSGMPGVLDGVCALLINQQQSWEAWAAGCVERAVPTLSAWALGTAPHVADISQPAVVPGIISTGTGVDVKSYVAVEILQAVAAILLLPGGVLLSPAQPAQAGTPEQLLLCAELTLRVHSKGPLHPAATMGVLILKAFVTHDPTCFDALWRSGALAALVVTVSKMNSTYRLAVAIGQLLDALVPQPGQVPWFAGSAEKQQFALLVLARLGGRLARWADSLAALAPLTMALGRAAMAADAEGALIMVESVLKAGLQLAGQPLIHQLVAQAAPSALQELQAESPAAVQGRPLSASAAAQPSAAERRARRTFLASLSAQLDPLALGLALPGCYNPACTSLAGVSEAAMPLKTCTGCRIARYCGPECAKAHWKHHKAGCKSAAAAAAVAASKGQV